MSDSTLQPIFSKHVTFWKNGESIQNYITEDVGQTSFLHFDKTKTMDYNAEEAEAGVCQ